MDTESQHRGRTDLPPGNTEDKSVHIRRLASYSDSDFMILIRPHGGSGNHFFNDNQDRKTLLSIIDRTLTPMEAVPFPPGSTAPKTGQAIRERLDRWKN